MSEESERLRQKLIEALINPLFDKPTISDREVAFGRYFAAQREQIGMAMVEHGVNEPWFINWLNSAFMSGWSACLEMVANAEKE